jgi:PAS domain S-box-containing protein
MDEGMETVGHSPPRERSEIALKRMAGRLHGLARDRDELHSNIIYRIASSLTPGGRYGLAVCLFLLALGIRLLLPIHVGAPFITFYPAALVAVAIGGLGPGLTVVGLAVAATHLLFLGVADVFTLGSGEVPVLATFAVAAPLICGVVDRMLHGLTKASEVHDHLRASMDSLRDDIAERRRIELALRESNERFRSAFENAVIGMALAAPDGQFMQVNRTLCDLLGYSEAELLQRRFHDVTHPDDLATNLALLEGLLAGNYPSYRMEKRYLHRSGAVIWALVSVSLVTDEAGRPIHCISQIQDVTEVKRAEDQRRALEGQLRHAQTLEIVGGLASGLAHHLNNILTPVGGYAQLIRTGQKDGSKDAQRAERILAAVNRARDLVTKLVLVSRDEDGDLRPIAMAGPVQEALALFEAAIDSSTITVSLDLPPDLWKVNADPAHIRQVAINLCSNAVHAAGEAGTYVRVSLANVRGRSGEQPPAPATGRWVKLSVEDDGPGMDKEVMARIFEPFFSTRRQQGASGLGMAIVERIVTRLGGRVSVISEPAQGCTVHLWLPAVTEDSGEMTAGTDTPARAGKGERILVVDDEPEILSCVGEALAKAGYNVVPAALGEEAWAAFRTASPPIDAVLTDVALPGMDGVALSHLVRTRHPGTPVIMMTGCAMVSDCADRAEPGIDPIITKPLDFIMLCEILSHLLEIGTSGQD